MAPLGAYQRGGPGRDASGGLTQPINWRPAAQTLQRAPAQGEKVKAKKGNQPRREEGRRRAPHPGEGPRGLGEKKAVGGKWMREAGPRGGLGGSSSRKTAARAKRVNGPEGPLSTVIQLSAGVPGLEPRLTGPEPVGLPITPYPNAATKSRSRQHTLAEISLGRERKRHWRLGRRPGGPANGRGRAEPSPRAAAASRGGR
jgi:hypothetical protein